MADPDDIDDYFSGANKKYAFLSYLAEGEWLLLRKEYANAAKSFTAALNLNPSDKRGYVARCKCYLHMGELDNAIKDADASLKTDKKFHEGLYLKAEALYRKGEYEFALMYYERGQKVRANFEGFRLGIQKAQQAIENSTSGTLFLPVARSDDLPQREDEDDRKSRSIRRSSVFPASSCSILDLSRDKKPQAPQGRRGSKAEKPLNQLCGELYNQKKFLQDLMKDEEFSKCKTKRGEQLQDIIRSSLKSIDICADAWTTEKPPSKKNSKTKPKSEALLEPSEFVMRSFEDIDAELSSGHPDDSLKKAEEVLKVVQTYSEKDVPNKKELIGFIHSYIGTSFFELGDMKKALEHHQSDLDLAQLSSHPDAISRALENMGRTCAKMGDFEKAIHYWKKKIILVHCELEKTWLLHEIGCCYMELKQYEEARDCGILATALAEEIADQKWMIKTNVLVGQCELCLENFQSSASYFEEALIHARKEDDDFAIDAIQRVLDNVKLNIDFQTEVVE